MGIAAVIWAPVRVLRNVAAQRDVLAGFVVTAVYAALSLATAAASVFAGVTRAQFAGQPAPPGLPPGALESLVRATEVATLVLSVLTPFVWWVAVSLVMQLVTRFFNGEGPLSAMMAVVGVAGAPLALGTLVWHVVLVVVGAALARRIGYGESAGSCAVSCAGCLALIILVAVVLVGIGILVGTTAPQ